MSVTDQQINNLLDEFLKLHPKRIDLSLNRVKKLLSKLGNPHEKIKGGIVVTGSNAKYSVLRFIQEILRFNNKTLNTYISPHLIRFNERFEYRDKQISNEDLEKGLIRIKEINNSESITFFEATSSCFYDLCSKNQSDYTLIETGCGGMYDVSALVTPLLTVITPISFDHMELLAPKSGSIQEVAHAKSGSIKEGIPCIVGKQTYREALEILIDQAEHKRAPLFIYDRDWIVYEEKEEIVYEDNQNKFQFKNFKYHPTYQVDNLGLAIATVSQIPNINIDGFLESNLHEKTEIIGRFQKIEDLKINSFANNDVEIIYDGGHNSAAGAGIYKSIEKLDKKPLCIVLGMISSKNPEDFISQFDQIECIRTITIQNEESAITAEDLKHKVNKFCDDTDTSTSINEAVKSISSKHSNARILITGSFYMAKEVFN